MVEKVANRFDSNFFCVGDMQCPVDFDVLEAAGIEEEMVLLGDELVGNLCLPLIELLL